ncbi:hypothetical protein D9M68_776320 [compost metagenome]
MAAGRTLVAAGLGQAGVDLPAVDAAGRGQLHQAGQVILAMHAQKDAGAVEEAVGFVQVRAAHRQVPGVDHVFHSQRAVAGRRLPSVVVRFVDGQAAGARIGRQRFDLAREVADQVAARNPGRQGQALAAGGGRRYG